MEEREVITGYISNYIYESYDSMYKVCELVLENEATVIIVGSFPHLEDGLNYEFIGHMKKHPKYGQVTIAMERNNWKPDQWDLSWYSNEKREFKVIDEDFLCGYAKRLNRFKKELDLSLLSLNAEVENENG